MKKNGRMIFKESIFLQQSKNSEQNKINKEDFTTEKIIANII